MKIYTRSGDRGDTGLFDGTRVSKAHPRVAACGEVDELNALLGFARASGPGAELSDLLARLQRDLFAIGATLADPAERIADRVTKASIGPEDVERLEQWIDRFEAELPPLGRFVLPGGSVPGATLHLARTVCRRAERAIVVLGPDAVEATVLAFVNRLSDLLFVLARVANRRANAPDLEW